MQTSHVLSLFKSTALDEICAGFKYKITFSNVDEVYTYSLGFYTGENCFYTLSELTTEGKISDFGVLTHFLFYLIEDQYKKDITEFLDFAAK